MTLYLVSSQTKQPLFQYRIFAVPECQSQAQPTLTICDAQQPVLAPAVSTGPGMVMWEIIPAKIEQYNKFMRRELVMICA